MIMASSVTTKDLRGQWLAYLAAARSVGFDTDGWTLHTGSGTQGVAYRATMAGEWPAPGTMHDGMHNAHLGMTRGDAYRALVHMTRTLEAVHQAKINNDLAKIFAE